MSLVNEQIKAARNTVSVYSGAILFMKGFLWKMVEQYVDMAAKANMTSVEAIWQMANTFLNKPLSPQDCAAIDSIRGLRRVITAEKDGNTVIDLERAIAKNPVGMATEQLKFINSAKWNVTNEIIMAWKHLVSDEFDEDGNARTVEQKAAALVEGFGMNQREATRLAESASGSVLPVDIYALSGVNSDTLEPY